MIIVAAVLAAMSGNAALAQAAETQDTVRLAPVPGVSFDVPKGWVACDTTTDALLGNAADPQHLKQPICNAPGLTFKLRAFDPRPFRTISMLVDQHKEQDLSQTDLDAITPQVAATLAPAVCPVITKSITSDGTKIESCTVDVGTFAAHKALISTIVAVPPNDPTAKFELHIYELPYTEGYLQVQFNALQLYLPTTRPVMDAIVSSFTVD